MFGVVCSLRVGRQLVVAAALCAPLSALLLPFGVCGLILLLLFAHFDSDAMDKPDTTCDSVVCMICGNGSIDETPNITLPNADPGYHQRTLVGATAIRITGRGGWANRAAP